MKKHAKILITLCAKGKSALSRNKVAHSRSHLSVAPNSALCLLYDSPDFSFAATRMRGATADAIKALTWSPRHPHLVPKPLSLSSVPLSQTPRQNARRVMAGQAPRIPPCTGLQTRKNSLYIRRPFLHNQPILPPTRLFLNPSKLSLLNSYHRQIALPPSPNPLLHPPSQKPILFFRHLFSCTPTTYKAKAILCEIAIIDHVIFNNTYENQRLFA